ncbi:hypothetical protein [Deinococcus cellulosilyticus]|uniref:hypothetical protein n=1 Tax=Deinococcus cellulosilyticus TaxID=401558 RepID=UPI0011BE1D77|nr:hypothetical protein [Deinococcus cellulosilyticus]
MRSANRAFEVVVEDPTIEEIQMSRQLLKQQEQRFWHRVVYGDPQPPAPPKPPHPRKALFRRRKKRNQNRRKRP